MPVGRGDPRRPDPFQLFGAYPTRTLAVTDSVALAPGVTRATVARLRSRPLVWLGAETMAGEVLTERLVQVLAQRGGCTVGELLALGGADDAAALLRTIGWLAKLDLLRLQG